MPDLIAAVDYARKSRGGPFVGVADGHGPMMFNRQLFKASLKGLKIMSAEVAPWRETKRALHVFAVGENVKARRVFVPVLDWKQSKLLGAWQRANLRSMGRCDCYEFHRFGSCKHIQSKPQGKHEAAIAKLEKQVGL